MSPDFVLRLYRASLQFQPERLRTEFGDEMLELLRDDLAACIASRAYGRAFRTCRIAFQEAIPAILSACIEEPRIAVPSLTAALTFATQSPLLMRAIYLGAPKTFFYALGTVGMTSTAAAATALIMVLHYTRTRYLGLHLGGPRNA